MNIIAIHQPNYIPWLGYFFKIYQSETFVFLDTVQYSNKGMHDFHYIKNSQGRFRLKIPVQCNFGDNIQDVILNNTISWKENHLKQIEYNYKKALHFKKVFTDLNELFIYDDTTLVNFNARIIKFISEKFNITANFINSSDLDLDAQSKNDRIFEICKKTNATVYYSGTGAAVYQNENDFKEHGIELRYSTFTPFIYPQLWGDFESNVSVIDYLMNCGYDWERVLESQKTQ